jgi:hypothetical protein
MAPDGCAPGYVADRLRRIAEGRVEPHLDVEAAYAINERADGLAADAGLHHLQNLVGVDPETRRFFAVDLHDQLRLALVGFQRQVGDARYTAQDRLVSARQAVEFGEVWSVEFEGKRRAHARDQFFDAHLDRLGVAYHHGR